MNIFTNIINIIFVLLGIVIIAGFIIRVYNDKFAAVREVRAKVVNKQNYTNRVYSKSRASFDKAEYVITFLCGDKKLHFNVSAYSYDGYKIGQAGILKYKGSKIIEFREMANE